METTILYGSPVPQLLHVVPVLLPSEVLRMHNDPRHGRNPHTIGHERTRCCCAMSCTRHSLGTVPTFNWARSMAG